MMIVKNEDGSYEEEDFCHTKSYPEVGYISGPMPCGFNMTIMGRLAEFYGEQAKEFYDGMKARYDNQESGNEKVRPEE